MQTEGVALLAEYKQSIVADYISRSLEAEASERKFLETFEVPTTDFHPIPALKGVALYLGMVDAVFGLRQSAASMP